MNGINNVRHILIKSGAFINQTLLEFINNIYQTIKNTIVAEGSTDLPDGLTIGDFFDSLFNNVQNLQAYKMVDGDYFEPEVIEQINFLSLTPYLLEIAMQKYCEPFAIENGYII